MKTILIIVTILNMFMEQCFSSLLEDIRYQISLILILSTTNLDLLKQSKFTADEINIIKNLAPENLHGQKCLKEYFALYLLAYVFSV